MSKALIIVESPAKARTIGGFLAQAPELFGGEKATAAAAPVVKASIGHVRDLPRNNKEAPESSRGLRVTGVDVENDFKPVYVVTPGKQDVIRDLRRELKGVDELYLATDEDREGEAIAWHLLEVLNPPSSMPVRRMVFHEITPEAIRHAVENPRDLDRRLVDAQETRRLLDRLVGWEVAPVLWRKIAPALSAGRVQSVGVRLVVERERERMRFRAAGYWDIEGVFASDGGRSFPATLVALDSRRLATGRDFDESGQVSRPDLVVLDEVGATTLADELASRPFAVRSVERKPYKRSPARPFTTSTLQQEAGRKLRFTSAATMRAAQGLYENGYITYMRTDSTTLSDTALSAARAVVAERYGRQYLPDEPRRYANKTKNAQEAHEAIRPAGESFRSPEAVAREVNSDQARLYELIWKRTVASQMTDAVGETVTVRLGATTIAGRDAEFSTSGTIITHQGFRLVYIEDVDERSDGDATERQLPPLVEGDPLRAEELTPQGHQTQPPARFTEASLVKRLEELGVGRPSTYASIIQTIQERGYVWKKGAALVPSFTAFAVTNLLEQKFDDVVDYAFTARLEDDLDAIARGDQESVPWLARFYWGHGDEAGLRSRVDDIDDIDARAVNSIPIGLDPDGVLVEARAGRYGPFLSRGEDTASIPDDLPPDELTVERALELLAAPKGDREVGVDPETGRTVYARAGRFGPYVQLGEVEEGSKVKPPTASLFKTMSAEAVTLEEALRLLSLPRIVGVDPADGTEITAQNGRYGPYIKKGSDSRSLETEEQLFTITLEECLKVLAEPKRRRGQTTAAPLRELGEDPSTGRPMVIKDGRFGPYVTDGETNASLRKGDEVETLTVERGSELLADRRSRGPVTRKRGAKKAATKKAPAKKAAAKRSAKKASAKKAAAKKAPAGRSAKKAVPPGDA